MSAGGDTPELGDCPICSRAYPFEELELHVELCLAALDAQQEPSLPPPDAAVNKPYTRPDGSPEISLDDPSYFVPIHPSFLPQLRAALRYPYVEPTVAALNAFPHNVGRRAFGWAMTFDPTFVESCAWRGYFPMAILLQDDIMLMAPKLHQERCVVAPLSAYVIHRSLRGAAARMHVTLNAAFDDVVNMCVFQHGSNWLCPRLAKAFGHIHQHPERYRIRLITIEVWQAVLSSDNASAASPRHNPHGAPVGEAAETADSTAIPSLKASDASHAVLRDVASGRTLRPVFDAAGRRLVACELGYVCGAMYTSLTGARTVSSSGTVQLAAMARLLQRCGFAVWDFGMEMEYKRELGAHVIPRAQWLDTVQRNRSKATPLTLAGVRDDIAVHDRTGCSAADVIFPNWSRRRRERQQHQGKERHTSGRREHKSEAHSGCKKQRSNGAPDTDPRLAQDWGAQLAKALCSALDHVSSTLPILGESLIPGLQAQGTPAALALTCVRIRKRWKSRGLWTTAVTRKLAGQCGGKVDASVVADALVSALNESLTSLGWRAAVTELDHCIALWPIEWDDE